MYRNTYVEINLDNIENNIEKIIKKYNNYDYYFGVVKGDAYGHGMFIVNSIIEKGINYLAVSNIDEALEIRKYNQNIPILCLEPINKKYLDICSKNNITLTISSKHYVDDIKSFNQKLKIHLKVDSGMNRLGFDNADELFNCYHTIKNNKNINIEGIYTHMATLGINDPYWDRQLQTFKDITKLIDLKEIPIIHIDRSVTMMCHPKIEFCNGVRLGISIYGYNQIPTAKKTFINSLKDKIRIKKYNISKTILDTSMNLKPAFSLFSEVIEIKTVKKGEFIGYFGYVNNSETFKVATVAIGYADGLDLRTKNHYVFINDTKYQIIGTINSGMISVKIDNKVKIGDKVEIIGEKNNIRNLSQHNNTTIYETMTTISQKLPKIYVKGNKVINIQNEVKE